MIRMSEMQLIRLHVCLDLTTQIYVDYISGVAYFLGHRLKMGKQYAKYYLQEKIAELHMCNDLVSLSPNLLSPNPKSPTYYHLVPLSPSPIIT